MQKQDVINFLTLLKKQPKGFVYSENQSSPSNTKQQQLDQLYEPYKQCTACPLGTQGRTNVVFGSGNPNADIMFIGEGPGQNEDLQGLPFVGRAGRLLTHLLEKNDIKRADCFIANVVKCRPPNNRTPLPNEVSICTNLLLFKQIAIIEPKLLCLLGSAAAQALLGSDTKISKVRGVLATWHIGDQKMLVIPTYHPAYLLRNPAATAIVEGDLAKIKLSI